MLIKVPEQFYQLLDWSLWKQFASNNRTFNYGLLFFCTHARYSDIRKFSIFNRLNKLY